MTKRMKTREVRDQWKTVLDDVEAGEEIIIERYNQPIARLVPIKEPAMTLTADNIQVICLHDDPDLLDQWGYEGDAGRYVIEQHGEFEAYVDDAPDKAQLPLAEAKIAAALGCGVDDIELVKVHGPDYAGQAWDVRVISE